MDSKELVNNAKIRDEKAAKMYIVWRFKINPGQVAAFGVFILS